MGCCGRLHSSVVAVVVVVAVPDLVAPLAFVDLSIQADFVAVLLRVFHSVAF